MVRTYLPFAAGGFALRTALMMRRGVVAELVRGEGDLADRNVDDRRLVDAELHLTGLDLLERLGDVERDGAGLRVRHQSAGTEDFAELSDRAHHVRRGDDGVVIDPATLDLLDHVVAADEISAGFRRFALFVALCDDEHAFGLAGAVREHGRAADHLIGVLGIDTEKHRELDRLVELGVRDLLEQRERFVQLVRPLLDLLGRCTILLAVFGHFTSVVLAAAARASYVDFAAARAGAP